MRIFRRVFLCGKVEQEVVVVGAGPTGLVLANLLGSFGIRVLVLEKDPQLPQHPKAHFINHRTMEILRPFRKLVHEVQKRTPALEEWRRFIYCETLTNGMFAKVDHFENQSTPFQLQLSPEPLAHLSQNKLLELLLANTRTLDTVQVLFGMEVVHCENEGNGVLISMKSEKFREQKIKSLYTVIANGANSAFLPKLDIKTQNMDILQNLVSVHFYSKELSDRLRGSPGMIYFVFNSDVVLVLVVHNLQEAEFVAQIPYFPPLQRPSDFDAVFCTRLIQKSITESLKDVKIQSIKPWRMKTELAERFQKDRIFLVGDAAHVFPPAGGFGMNTGIQLCRSNRTGQDAQNLAWKLAAVIKGWDSRTLLDSYSEERFPVVKRNAELSVENWKIAMEIPGALGLHPANAELLNRVISGPLSSLLLPQSISRTLLETGLSLGRQMSGFRGPFANWRKQKVQEILKTGQSLKLQFPKEDLGFVYHTMRSDAPRMDQRMKTRDPVFNPGIEIGGRFPHCFVQVKTSRKIISSLDLITWSKLRYSVFFNGPNTALISSLKTKSISKLLTLISVEDHHHHKEKQGPLLEDYVPFKQMQEQDCVISGDSDLYLIETLDINGTFKDWLSSLKEDVIVVRPDGHILTLTQSQNLETFESLLKRTLV